MSDARRPNTRSSTRRPNPRSSPSKTPSPSSSGKQVSQTDSGKRLRCTLSSGGYVEFSCLRCAGDIGPNQYQVSGSSSTDTDFNRVDRLAIDANYILTHKKCGQKLMDFLPKGDVFDKTHLKANVYRPTDDTRKIILSLVKSAFDLHDSKLFHGNLIPENIGVYLLPDTGLPSRLARNDYKVVLLPINQPFERRPGEEVPLGMYSDFEGLTSIIFDHILGGAKKEEFAPDVQYLYELMSKGSFTEKKSLIANNPSLMDIDARDYYYERVWEKYSTGTVNEKTNIPKAAENALKRGMFGDWRKRIPYDTPIQKIYQKNNYGASGIELLRFLRILGYHRRDPENETFFRGNKSVYLTTAYLEMKVNEAFPLFMCYLHEALLSFGIDM